MQACRQADRQTSKQRGRWAWRLQACMHADKQTDRQEDRCRQAERQKERPTCRQASRQADKQTTTMTMTMNMHRIHFGRPCSRYPFLGTAIRADSAGGLTNLRHRRAPVSAAGLLLFSFGPCGSSRDGVNIPVFKAVGWPGISFLWFSLWG